MKRLRLGETKMRLIRISDEKEFFVGQSIEIVKGVHKGKHYTIYELVPEKNQVKVDYQISGTWKTFNVDVIGCYYTE